MQRIKIGVGLNRAKRQEALTAFLGVSRVCQELTNVFEQLIQLSPGVVTSGVDP